MNESMVMPCAEWAEKLTAAHPDDLPPSEREELEDHVGSCAACAIVRAQYRAVETLIRDLPADDAPADIPPKLLHTWEEDAKRPELKQRGAASLGVKEDGQVSDGGQAQGPHPSTTPPLVPTKQRGAASLGVKEDGQVSDGGQAQGPIHFK